MYPAVGKAGTTRPGAAEDFSLTKRERRLALTVEPARSDRTVGGREPRASWRSRALRASLPPTYEEAVGAGLSSRRRGGAESRPLWALRRPGESYGISRTMIRLVPPLAPVWRPAVITTRAPVGRPANSFAVTRADSTRSSTVAPTGIVRG